MEKKAQKTQRTQKTQKTAQEKKPSVRVRNEKWHLVKFIAISVGILIFVSVIVANFTTIKDFVVGLRYQPTADVEQIRADLNLTGTGWRIFNASMPELMEQVEFNQNCREVENETAILGCFRDDKIYVYNVVDEELPRIRELAMAHELLHAVYHRMPDKEKWSELLARVYKENKDILGEEIEIYPDDQKMEEIYVRAGTEIKNLPDELERHYGEIFVDQDKIADFYDGYITVFKKIKKKLEDLLAEANSLSDEVSAKTTDYEKRAEELNAKVGEFNECAKVVNCFSSRADFNNRRAALMAEQNALSALHAEITELTAKYNALATEYNENLLHGQVLNRAINSSAKVEAVKD